MKDSGDGESGAQNGEEESGEKGGYHQRGKVTIES